MILAIALCFLLAGTVKGITGMGLPTVVMCTLVFVMPGAKAAALLVVPSLITNFWQLFSSPGWVATLRRLALMLIAIVIGTFVGIGYLTGKSSPSANIILGLVLCIYALLALRSVKFSVPPKWEPIIAPVAGLATGVLGGTTGLFLVPAVPYIAALGLKRDQLIQALGLSFGISTISLAIALTSKGAFNVHQVGGIRPRAAPGDGGHVCGGIHPPPAVTGGVPEMVSPHRAIGGAFDGDRGAEEVRVCPRNAAPSPVRGEERGGAGITRRWWNQAADEANRPVS